MRKPGFIQIAQIGPAFLVLAMVVAIFSSGCGTSGLSPRHVEAFQRVQRVRVGQVGSGMLLWDEKSQKAMRGKKFEPSVLYWDEESWDSVRSLKRIDPLGVLFWDEESRRITGIGPAERKRPVIFVPPGESARGTGRNLSAQWRWPLRSNEYKLYDEYQPVCGFAAAYMKALGLQLVNYDEKADAVVLVNYYPKAGPDVYLTPRSTDPFFHERPDLRWNVFVGRSLQRGLVHSEDPPKFSGQVHVYLPSSKVIVRTWHDVEKGADHYMKEFADIFMPLCGPERAARAWQDTIVKEQARAEQERKELLDRLKEYKIGGTTLGQFLSDSDHELASDLELKGKFGRYFSEVKGSGTATVKRHLLAKFGSRCAVAERAPVGDGGFSFTVGYFLEYDYRCVPLADLEFKNNVLHRLQFR